MLDVGVVEGDMVGVLDVGLNGFVVDDIGGMYVGVDNAGDVVAYLNRDMGGFNVEEIDGLCIVVELIDTDVMCILIGVSVGSSAEIRGALIVMML